MRYLYVVVLFFMMQIVSGQTPRGRYEGALSRNGSVQLISFDFGKDKTRYDIPEIGYMDVVPEKISYDKDTLNVKIFYGDFYCLLNPETGDLVGVSRDVKPEMRIHLKKTAAKEKNFMEEEIGFSNGSVSLAGALFKPKTSAKDVPYVILVHRSGWEDRETPWYHSLANILASRGVGVLLYDKRGTGRSTGNFSSADFNDFADDAAAAFNYLKGRNDLNFSKIGFLGASQGGWVVPLAANRVAGCGFAILVVGPAVSLFGQDIHRVGYTLADEGFPKESVNAALHYSRLFFKYIDSNAEKDWKALKKYTSEISGQKWIDYVDVPQSKTGDDVSWWRRNKYDPKEALSTIKCPVLSILGEKDVLVPPAENKSKMEAYLAKAGVRHRIITLKDCTHDMITKATTNSADEEWPNSYWKWQRQPEEFVNSILAFIQE